MIAILDPALLQPRPDPQVLRDLQGVLKACRIGHLRLVPFEEYWGLMWKRFGRSLDAGSTDRKVRDSLRELQKLADRHSTNAIPSATGGAVWRKGFQQLFDSKWLDSDENWEVIMARVVVRAVMTNEKVVVLTRRIPKRNVVIHRANSSEIWENTRWLLHVQPPNIGPRHIPCVYDARNLDLRWTTRFDTRLPTVADGARYPFCPPNEWWKPQTTTTNTMHSKPCFVDAGQNGWARPNIPNGAGYHWDVFIGNHNMKSAVGLDQLNVVAFGAPPAEGQAGDIHHVPAKKRHVFQDTGWSCP